MSDKLERARDAAVEFFKTANPQDEFFMITFSDRPEVLSDFTKSVEDIQGKLIFTIAKGRTALLDAIYLGMDKMREARNSKKALLIISDGGDNRSRYTEGEIRSLVKEADVQIYAIGIVNSYYSDFAQGRTGRAVLEEMTEITGGKAYFPNSVYELEDICTKIAIELVDGDSPLLGGSRRGE